MTKELVTEILGKTDVGPRDLAARLGVTQATVLRWLDGLARPRPAMEGKLRALSVELDSNSSVSSPAFRKDKDLRPALDRLLADLRNALHRRGRISSRNEGLEEISKLIFAHVMSLCEGKVGITSAVVEGTNPAQSLREFVASLVDRHLPNSLEHEIGAQDFMLRLKPQEHELAREIAASFDRIADTIDKTDIARGIDILNDVFGKFLADSFSEEKELGQYLTPTEVVRFMVRLAIADLDDDEKAILVDPARCRDFGLILDPSCGVASFLAEVLAVLQPEVITRYGWDAAYEWASAMTQDVIVGIDKSERMIKLALGNLAMFGVPAAKLHLANALGRTNRDGKLTSDLEGRAGLILTNPPFGAEFRNPDLTHFRIASEWSAVPPAKVDSEILFIERYLDWLAPGGRCVAIVPDSILTNRGLFETLREQLAPEIEIRSVTSLPVVTFGAAGTQTKTSVLHFRKRKAAKAASRAFVAICRDVGFEVVTRGSQRTKVKHSDGELASIANDFVSKKSSDFGRWVNQVETTSRWDAGYHVGLDPEIVQRIENITSDDILVSDVADLANEREDPRRRGTGTFSYIEISDVDSVSCMVATKEVPCSDAPSRARKVVRTGDVLVSTVRPERRTVGVVRSDQDGAICTTGFAVLRPRKIHPLVLAALLKSDFVTSQVLRNNIGIAYPAIDESCLLKVLLPIENEKVDATSKSAETILETEQRSRALRREFDDKIGDLIKIWMKHDAATPGPKPHRSLKTKSHRQSRTQGSGERAQGSLKI